MRKILITAALVAFFALPTAALAQTTTTDYSGGTSTTSPQPTVVTQQQGTHGQGDTFTVESCGFSDGVALQWNGADAGSDTLNSAGCATQQVTILEDGVSLGAKLFAAAGLQLAAPTPQVSIDGRTFTAKSGSNTLSVFGVGTNGADRTVNNIIVIGGAAAGSGNGLPRTGAMILRWSLAALALIAVGGLLVLADRRRKVAPVHNDRTPRI
jgi:hypothetical protein